MASSASSSGPGGWDHLGAGGSGPNGAALNGDALALSMEVPGKLLIGGKFTDAGGNPDADRIATWNGTSWSSVGSGLGGDVFAVAYAGGRVFAGGTFLNAGGNADADFLAAWDGASWQPVCNSAGPAFEGKVRALQVIGNTIYVGGEFQDGADIGSADYLLACDLNSGFASSTVTDPAHPFNGPVYALSADTNGTLYAGGNFSDLDGNTSSDYVAAFSGGSWSNLGAGPGPGFGAFHGVVRSLAASGTTVYIGSDSVDVAAISQADHVARWNGAAWSAVGSNPAGTDGYLPPVSVINSLLASGSHVYATGSFQNASGDPAADEIVDFDGATWHPMGSDGSGNGPLPASGESLAMYGGQLHAGGNFTSAGGDTLAAFVARYALQPSEPDNAFDFGKLKRNTRKGTATLSVIVPGPGELALSGKGIRKGRATGESRLSVRPIAAAGIVKLTIKPGGKTKNKLAKMGSAKVTAKVKFTPTGGTTNTKSKKLKLVKRR